LAASRAREAARRSTRVWSVPGGGAVRLAASADGYSRGTTETKEKRHVPPSQGSQYSDESEGSSSEGEGAGDGNLEGLIGAALAAAHASCCNDMDRLRSQPDVEAVHDLRVTVRRLRSTLSIFAPFIQVPDALRPRALGKLLRSLGAVRDADVMLETLAAVQQGVGACGMEAGGGEQHAVWRFEQGVRKRQRQLLHDALHATGAKGAARIMHALKRSVGRVKPLSPAAAVVLQQHLSRTAPSLLTPHIASALLHHAWSIDDLVTWEDEPEAPHKQQQGSSSGNSGGGVGYSVVYRHGVMDHMHALRKLLRELRYRMDLMEGAYMVGGSFPAALQRVKRLQSILGEQQDLHVLADALLPHAAHMPATMLALHAQQLQVWEEWLGARETVCGVKESRQLYKAVLKPTPKRTYIPSLAYSLDLSLTPPPSSSHSAAPDLPSPPTTTLSPSSVDAPPTSLPHAPTSPPPLSSPLPSGTSPTPPAAAAPSASHSNLVAAAAVAPAAGAAAETTAETVSGEKVEVVGAEGGGRRRRRVRSVKTTSQPGEGEVERG
ncbi:hypothetical protein CLOM_g24291, partial [Closterium sp. NIES-68]